MTMDLEIEDIYSNINLLLNDICKFLSDEATYKNLSPLARKEADKLISRSKTQLQQIIKVKKSDEEFSGAYVDMERKVITANEDNQIDDDTIYSSVNESVPESLPKTIVSEDSFIDLPAKEMLRDVKYGALQWRTKFILTRFRKVFAGIHKNWLIIYSSEKDIKPMQTFYLKYFRAEYGLCKQNKNPQDFNVVSVLDDKKILSFVALTHKDMLQWVEFINRSHNNLKSTEDDLESYDIISPTDNNENGEDDEQIYNDIEPQNFVITPIKEDKPPDLPRRPIISKSKKPLPKIPDIESSKPTSHSNESISYDPVGSIPTSIDTDDIASSFSEEDDKDEIYEAFVQVQPSALKNPKKKEAKNGVLTKPLPKPKPKLIFRAK